MTNTLYAIYCWDGRDWIPFIPPPPVGAGPTGRLAVFRFSDEAKAYIAQSVAILRSQGKQVAPESFRVHPFALAAENPTSSGISANAFGGSAFGSVG